MADKKTNQYPTQTQINSDDTFLVGNTNTTFNITLDSLKSDLSKYILSKNYGAANAGKYLVVGSDGMITPTYLEVDSNG